MGKLIYLPVLGYVLGQTHSGGLLCQSPEQSWLCFLLHFCQHSLSPITIFVNMALSVLVFKQPFLCHGLSQILRSCQLPTPKPGAKRKHDNLSIPPQIPKAILQPERLTYFWPTRPSCSRLTWFFPSPAQSLPGSNSVATIQMQVNKAR